MSTEQPIDPNLLEETKQQIRNLVNEIAQLSRTNASPEQFYDQFLTRVVQALAAEAGAVWIVSESGQLELKFQIGLQQTGLAQNLNDQRRHGRLLQQVMTSGQGRLVPPYSGSAGEEDAGNPTAFLLVLGLLQSGEETLGMVEVFQRPGGVPNTQRGYLRFLQRMCELASDFLKTRQLRHLGDRQALWSQLEAFTQAAHQSLDPRQTAYTLANEGRRLIQCDRVSVAIRRGRHCTIEAVSGQDTFDKRSNTVTLLAQLATAVVRTGEPMWYTGDMSQLAPQVEEALDAYLDDAHSKTVAVLPLRRPIDESPGAEKKEIPPPVGAIIVEQIEDARPREGMLQRVEVVGEHGGTALANAIEHNSLFLMPVWRTIGHSKVLVTARNLPKTLAAVLALAAAIVALIVVPWDFNIEAKGSLQPVTKNSVFAKVNGEIMSVDVEDGQMVTKDQLLCKLKNVELNNQATEASKQLNAAQGEYAMLSRKLLNERLKPEERDQAEFDRSVVEVKLPSLQAQFDLYQQRLADLDVYSPIDGQIITWDVQNRLRGRPVQQGNLLMTVADPKGQWELEVMMSEDRMGFINEALKDQSLGPELQVEYYVAEDPGRKLHGTIRKIDEAAEVRGEDGNTVLVRVKIEEGDIPDLRPGAGVTAKVYCGRRPLGYVLFHDFVAWFQKLVFPYF